MQVSAGNASLLLIAGVAGGALNALAGGATFFTFPALLMAGLDPLSANATNFVALVPSNFAALPALRNELKRLGRALIQPLIAGGFGGLCGALALVRLGGGLFSSAVPYLMATATALFALAPHIRAALRRRDDASDRRGSFGSVLLIFLMSMYGGYFGAGLGQIILAALLFDGYDDFDVANALKNSVVAVISVVSIAVYGFTDTVAWDAAILMAVGAAVGGVLGGWLTTSISQKVLRGFVIASGTLLTLRYFLSGTH